MANIQQQTSSHKQHPSRLLSLPAELRNQIWEYVCSGIQYGLSFQLGPDSNPHRTEPPPREPTATLLLLVCRQVYEEMNLLLIRCGEFAIDYQAPPSTFINKMTERQKGAISAIYVDDCDFNGMIHEISKYWESFLTGSESENLAYEDHVPFAKLTGLGRIEYRVWTWSPRFEQSAPPGQLVNAVRLAMRQLGARDGVKISIKIKHGEDCEKVAWYYITI